LEWCNDFHRVCRAKYTRRSTTNWHTSGWIEK
jgi:hypothetical protein